MDGDSAAAAGSGVVRRGGGAATEFIYLFIISTKRVVGQNSQNGVLPHTSRRALREENVGVYMQAMIIRSVS